MRSAISPRLAMRILSKSWLGSLAGKAACLSARSAARRALAPSGGGERSSLRGRSSSGENDQRLAELDRLAVLRENGLDHARFVRLDLVHELHGLDDAERIAGLHGIADLDACLAPGRSGTVERP